MNRYDAHAAEKYANSHILNGRHIINHRTHEHYLIIGKMVFYWDTELQKYRLDRDKTPEDLRGARA